jgi:drug/metabolite transporter (DMT)-like permease
MDVISFFWFSVLGSSLVLFLIGAIRGVSFVDYPLESYLYFLAAGIITQVIGWFAINYAQGHLPATIVSPTLLGQPVMTAVLAVVLLNENITFWQFVGGTAIVFGIFLVHRSRAVAQIEEKQVESVIASTP